MVNTFGIYSKCLIPVNVIRIIYFAIQHSQIAIK